MELPQIQISTLAWRVLTNVLGSIAGLSQSPTTALVTGWKCKLRFGTAEECKAPCALGLDELREGRTPNRPGDAVPTQRIA